MLLCTAVQGEKEAGEPCDSPRSRFHRFDGLHPELERVLELARLLQLSHPLVVGDGCSVDVLLGVAGLVALLLLHDALRFLGGSGGHGVVGATLRLPVVPAVLGVVLHVLGANDPLGHLAASFLFRWNTPKGVSAGEKGQRDRTQWGRGSLAAPPSGFGLPYRFFHGRALGSRAARASATAGVASLPGLNTPSAPMRPYHLAAGSPHLPDATPTVSLFSGFAFSESGRVYESVTSCPSTDITTFGNFTVRAARRNDSTSPCRLSEGRGFCASLMRRSIHSDCFGVGLPLTSAPMREAANSALSGLLLMRAARAAIFCDLSILLRPICPVWGVWVDALKGR